MSDYIGQPDSLRNPFRMAWANLPMLLIGSVIVAGGWALVRAASPHPAWLTAVGIGLVVLPAEAVLAVGCLRLIRQQRFDVGQLLSGLPAAAGRSVPITVVPVLFALLTMVAARAWQQSGRLVFLGSLGACTGLLIIAAVLMIIALPYRLIDAVGVRQSWLVSVVLTVRNPVPVLGVLAAAVLVVWASAYLSFALLIVLPTPLALVWAGAVQMALERRGVADRPPPRQKDHDHQRAGR